MHGRTISAGAWCSGRDMAKEGEVFSQIKKIRISAGRRSVDGSTLISHYSREDSFTDEVEGFWDDEHIRIRIHFQFWCD